MTTPTPAPIRLEPRDGVAEHPVVVAVHGDDKLVIDANAPAEWLLDFLDDVDTIGDLVASHRYVKNTLGADQYAMIKTWRLTQVEYANLGAQIINICTGAVFGMGDHLDTIEAALIRTADPTAMADSIAELA